MRQVGCRNGTNSDGRRSKGWEIKCGWGSCGKREGREGSQKLAWWDRANEATFIAAETGTQALPSEMSIWMKRWQKACNYQSARRKHNNFNRKGQMRAVLQNAPCISGTGRASGSVIWNIIRDSSNSLKVRSKSPNFCNFADSFNYWALIWKAGKGWDCNFLWGKWGVLGIFF